MNVILINGVLASIHLIMGPGDPGPILHFPVLECIVNGSLKHGVRAFSVEKAR